MTFNHGSAFFCKDHVKKIYMAEILPICFIYFDVKIIIPLIVIKLCFNSGKILKKIFNP